MTNDEIAKHATETASKMTAHISKKEMTDSVNLLIENIDYWENPTFNDYFNNNGLKLSEEQKAKEIAEINLKWYYELGNSYDECYQSALQAMVWKDEQHAQEKQQWINKACEAFCKCECCANCGEHKSNCRILVDFKNAMKGE